MRGVSKTILIFIFVFALGLSGCSISHPPSPNLAAPSQTARQLTAVLETPTSPAPPTATSEPLAASVDGVGIPLAAFQTSLAQLQKADTDLKKPAVAADQRQRVLDDLVDQALLAAAAQKDGFQLAKGDLDAKLTALTAQAGGPSALQTWETANGYTDASLRDALRASLAAAWERDHILAGVPATADQVHAQQILVPDEATAQTILGKLQAGAKFAPIAQQYDPVAGGDLGWFPKGYLTVPEVEAAAFSLQPGQTSEIVHSRLGYHIINVIERDVQHVLSPDARLVVQQAALRTWLQDRRSQSQIKILAP
jgi:peptidyl-prolyl cis-trans isomerase C